VFLGSNEEQLPVSARQRTALEWWAKHTGAMPEERVRIVLLSADRIDDQGHAGRLGVNWQRVARWRKRWRAALDHLDAAEERGVSDSVLVKLVGEVLRNAQCARGGQSAVVVSVSERQRAILDQWVRNAAATPYRLAQRCRIVLMSCTGMGNTEQARVLGVDRQRVRRWRQRWFSWQNRLAKAEAEGASDRDLAKLMSEALTDAPRAGAPGKFTAEQLTQIISVACESPDACGRPVTHWTPRELVDEVVKRQIVDGISPRHLDRFLKRGLSGHTRPSTG
jgi:putative transposase